MKIVSWNIAQRSQPWHSLLQSEYDLALLQEAAEPPADVVDRVGVDSAPWRTVGGGGERPWRTAVANLSDRVRVKWLEAKSLERAGSGEVAVSRLGSVAAATVTAPDTEPITVVSIYGVWERPYSGGETGWIYADASVHRLISDLSALIERQNGHRIIAAGDLNILLGYGEYRSKYWATRYATVFERMEAIGLSFVGPQAPHGRQAAPWPDELPEDSKNVPTYHTTRQSPATATRQLDFVFASPNLAERLQVRALNDPEHWGQSDHCRIEIELP